MKLHINKSILKAGDIVEVTWDCPETTAVRLVLNTGVRETSMAIPPSGSKRFRMKSSKGHHSVGLRATVNGRERSIKRHIFVYGKSKDTDEFEYIDRGDSSPLNRWNAAAQAWWQSYTPEKKRPYILLLLLIAYNILQSIPAVAPVSVILYYGIIFWLFWQVVKK